MDTILCKINDHDANELNRSIAQLEISDKVYKSIAKDIDFTPDAFKIVYQYYIKSYQEHKDLWQKILIKYIGEENASKYYKILRFDPIKNVIFKLEVEGCYYANHND